MLPAILVKIRYWETSNKYFLHQASKERKAAGNRSEVREEFLRRRGRRAGVL